MATQACLNIDQTHSAKYGCRGMIVQRSKMVLRHYRPRRGQYRFWLGFVMLLFSVACV